MTATARRIDTAHHHPHVRRTFVGWTWECSCGGASQRAAVSSTTWRAAVISALNHSVCLAA